MAISKTNETNNLVNIAGDVFITILRDKQMYVEFYRCDALQPFNLRFNPIRITGTILEPAH